MKIAFRIENSAVTEPTNAALVARVATRHKFLQIDVREGESIPAILKGIVKMPPKWQWNRWIGTVPNSHQLLIKLSSQTI